MSYELCVLDAKLAATRESAHALWDQSTYWDTSLPDHDRAARKWQISDALMAFNPALQRKPPGTSDAGLLSRLTGDKKQVVPYLALSLQHGDLTTSLTTSFCVFDQAVEIDLAWHADQAQAREVAREAWRHLQELARLGFTTVLDTERNALVDLNVDFEVVLAGYLANLRLDGEVDAADAAAVAKPPAPAMNQPFAGNVEPLKPWWKFW